ncbi:MAG TPA: hypothetical protein VGD98_06755 [Ktedonobacteraceae bacterium]
MLDPASFAYDQQAPLALHVENEQIQSGALVRDLTYASPHGGQVPAYLILPLEQLPQAGLIFGHWGQGDRSEFVDEALVLARLGFAALCLDAPLRRADSLGPQRTQPQMEFQWIADVRRGVDVLLEVGNLTQQKLGYVGHSYGATFGGVLTGIERRISAFVLLAGWYAMSEMARTSSVPPLAQARATIPPELFAQYMDAMAPLDARHYITQAAPAHLFFQFARADTAVLEKDAQRYFELASEPKRIAWYDNCGHELSTQARLERAAWLCETLHLPPPSQEIIRLLEQVPSPTPLT